MCLIGREFLDRVLILPGMTAIFSLEVVFIQLVRDDIHVPDFLIGF